MILNILKLRLCYLFVFYTNLEIDGFYGENYSSVKSLVRDETIEASNVLRRISAFVDQGVEWRSEPACWRTPAREYLVTSALRHSIPVPRIVEKVVMCPIVKR